MRPDVVVTDLLSVAHYVNNLVKSQHPSERSTDMNPTYTAFDTYCSEKGAPTLGLGSKRASWVHVALSNEVPVAIQRSERYGVDEIVKRLTKYPGLMKPHTKGMTCYISEKGDTSSQILDFCKNAPSPKNAEVQDRLLDMQKIASAADLPLTTYVEEDQAWKHFMAAKASSRLIGQNTMCSSHPDRLVQFLANPTEEEFSDTDLADGTQVGDATVQAASSLEQARILLDPKWSLKVKLLPVEQSNTKWSAKDGLIVGVDSGWRIQTTAPYRDAHGHLCWSDPRVRDTPTGESRPDRETSTSATRPGAGTSSASESRVKDKPTVPPLPATTPWSEEAYGGMLSCLVAQRRLARACVDVYRQHTDDPSDVPRLAPTVIELPTGSDVLKTEIEAGLQAIIDQSRHLKGGQYLSAADFEVTMAGQKEK